MFTNRSLQETKAQSTKSPFEVYLRRLANNNDCHLKGLGISERSFSQQIWTELEIEFQDYLQTYLDHYQAVLRQVFPAFFAKYSDKKIWHAYELSGVTYHEESGGVFNKKPAFIAYQRHAHISQPDYQDGILFALASDKSLIMGRRAKDETKGGRFKDLSRCESPWVYAYVELSHVLKRLYTLVQTSSKDTSAQTRVFCQNIITSANFALQLAEQAFQYVGTPSEIDLMIVKNMKTCARITRSLYRFAVASLLSLAEHGDEEAYYYLFENLYTFVDLRRSGPDSFIQLVPFFQGKEADLFNLIARFFNTLFNEPSVSLDVLYARLMTHKKGIDKACKGVEGVIESSFEFSLTEIITKIESARENFSYLKTFVLIVFAHLLRTYGYLKRLEAGYITLRECDALRFTQVAESTTVDVDKLNRFQQFWCETTDLPFIDLNLPCDADERKVKQVEQQRTFIEKRFNIYQFTQPFLAEVRGVCTPLKDLLEQFVYFVNLDEMAEEQKNIRIIKESINHIIQQYKIAEQNNTITASMSDTRANYLFFKRTIFESWRQSKVFGYKAYSYFEIYDFINQVNENRVCLLSEKLIQSLPLNPRAKFMVRLALSFPLLNIEHVAQQLDARFVVVSEESSFISVEAANAWDNKEMISQYIVQLIKIFNQDMPSQEREDNSSACLTEDVSKLDRLAALIEVALWQYFFHFQEGLAPHTLIILGCDASHLESLQSYGVTLMEDKLVRTVLDQLFIAVDKACDEIIKERARVISLKSLESFKNPHSLRETLKADEESIPSEMTSVLEEENAKLLGQNIITFLNKAIFSTENETAELLFARVYYEEPQRLLKLWQTLELAEAPLRAYKQFQQKILKVLLFHGQSHHLSLLLQAVQQKKKQWSQSQRMIRRNSDNTQRFARWRLLSEEEDFFSSAQDECADSAVLEEDQKESPYDLVAFSNNMALTKGTVAHLGGWLAKELKIGYQIPESTSPLSDFQAHFEKSVNERLRQKPTAASTALSPTATRQDFPSAYFLCEELIRFLMEVLDPQSAGGPQPVAIFTLLSTLEKRAHLNAIIKNIPSAIEAKRDQLDEFLFSGEFRSSAGETVLSPGSLAARQVDYQEDRAQQLMALFIREELVQLLQSKIENAFSYLTPQNIRDITPEMVKVRLEAAIEKEDYRAYCLNLLPFIYVVLVKNACLFYPPKREVSSSETKRKEPSSPSVPNAFSRRLATASSNEDEEMIRSSYASSLRSGVSGVTEVNPLAAQVSATHYAQLQAQERQETVVAHQSNPESPEQPVNSCCAFWLCGGPSAEEQKPTTQEDPEPSSPLLASPLDRYGSI